MGNRKHSKIDKLDPAVKETVDEMIKTGAYYREIVAYIKSNGVSVSMAAVGRQCQQLKRYWHLPRIKNQTRIQRK